MRLSHAQRWALLAAFNGDDTDHIHGSTINSLLSRGLIQWIDDSNRYANGRGGYITTPAGQELAETLESVHTNLTRSEHRSWAVHRQLATHLTSTSLTDWAPTILANLKRLRVGVHGQPHLDNLDRWQHIVATNDLPALRRALTGLERHDIEMREVTPMGGLLADDERRQALTTALYLVRDGNRTVALAAEHNGKLYCYVPNVDAFVYNKPMSVDFLIDQAMTYEPQTSEQAADVIKNGTIGSINRANTFLREHMDSEIDRLPPAEVLGPPTTPRGVGPRGMVR